MNRPTAPICRALRLAYPVAALLAITAALPAAGPAPAPDTHVLFMGADLLLPMDKQAYPVEAVTVNALIIKVDGQPVEVSYLRVADVNIKESLKITRASVGIQGLKAEQAYTQGADPFTQMNNAEGLVSAQGAMADLPRTNAATAAADIQATESIRDLVERARVVQEVEQALNQANVSRAAASNVTSQAGSLSDGARLDTVTPSGALAPMYDAIRVYFTVTADKKLEQPYYAVLAQIRDRGAKPGQVRKWAYVKALEPMSAGEARKVVIYRGGLPPGYHLDSYEVHFYDGPEELATNLSRKRVPLSDDEARQYRIVEYIGANKGRTLPAAPMTAALPGEVRGQLSPAQLAGTYYVKVAKSGEVTGVFQDAAGQQPPSDATLESALKTLRFKPALEAGKPVEALAEVKPAWLDPR